MSTPQKPVRIQRQRTKGWRMPENTVYVGRPTMFGNPFRIGTPNADDVMTCADAEEAVVKFRSEITTFGGGFVGLSVEDIQRELRGKNLACWCALDQSCHADVLLELANPQEVSMSTPTDRTTPYSQHGSNIMDAEKRVIATAWPIADPEGSARAEFIVRACNSHYELVAALKLFMTCYPAAITALTDDMRQRIERAIQQATGAEKA